jgi:hypothetical protein
MNQEMLMATSQYSQTKQLQAREQNSRTDKIADLKNGRKAVVDHLLDNPFAESRNAKPSLKLASESDKMVHPAFRSEAETHGSRLKTFVHNLMPRSPTKETFEMSILDDKLKPIKAAEGKPRLSLITWMDKQSPLSASPRDELAGSLSSLMAENWSGSEGGALGECESRAITPSKAARVLGMSDGFATPNKVTRILGHGLEGEDELPKKRLGKRLSSGELRTASPSGRVARLIEGAAARLSKVRDTWDFSEIEEDVAGHKGSENGNEADTDIYQTQRPRAFRSSSLKYMDNNTVPPTPPDKDTIYRGIRPKSEQAMKPHIGTVFRSNTQIGQQYDRAPIVRGEKGSRRANLVSKASIYSMSGIIEGKSTIRSVHETMDDGDEVEVSLVSLFLPLVIFEHHLPKRNNIFLPSYTMPAPTSISAADIDF